MAACVYAVIRRWPGALSGRPWLNPGLDLRIWPSWVGSALPKFDLQIFEYHFWMHFGSHWMQKSIETRSGDGTGSQKLGLGMPLGAKARGI